MAISGTDEHARPEDHEEITIRIAGKDDLRVIPAQFPCSPLDPEDMKRANPEDYSELHIEIAGEEDLTVMPFRPIFPLTSPDEKV